MSELSELSVAPSAYFTTSQAAQLCVVDPRTIARWTDAGLLRSHRTAGGRRRIVRSDLLAFMKDRGIPIPGRVAPSGPLRIAVIDDEPHFAKAVRLALTRIAPGAECRVAHDGFAAGTLLGDYRPDLILLDIAMPGMSGIEVCRYVRSEPRLAGTYIVVASGHLTDEVQAQARAAGADRCIAKPLGRSELTSIVHSVISRTSQVQAL
ncbi:MAG: response regulator [Myxococcales bacterium]|nr:response regulator [Myxococcales bacterium]